MLLREEECADARLGDDLGGFDRAVQGCDTPFSIPPTANIDMSTMITQLDRRQR